MTSARKVTEQALPTKKAVAKKPVRASVKAPAKAPAKKALPSSVAKTVKPKEKLVRDSFTMPNEDFAVIGVLKNRALIFKRPAKKSELLRAGLHALQALDDTALRTALDSLTPLKAGRPKQKVG